MGIISKDEIKELNEAFVSKIQEMPKYGKSIVNAAADFVRIKAREKSFSDMIFPPPIDVVKEAASLILEKVYRRYKHVQHI